MADKSPQQPSVQRHAGRTWNFSAGPGVLPVPVLEEAQAHLLLHPDPGAGCSVLEMSHRSPAFLAILQRAKADLGTLLGVPTDTHDVLFLQGGATAQFAAVALNLVHDASAPVDYMITGAWSEKAAKEAAAMGANVHIAYRDPGSNGCIRPQDFAFSQGGANYVYYCDNETVHGVEMPVDLVRAHLPPGVPVVCDMSSNLLSRRFDVSAYGCIFAGAQKNMGPAGVTVVIVRRDLLARRPALLPAIPMMLSYKVFADHDSLYNTPPTFAIYLCGLVFRWLLEEVGGLAQMEARNATKARALLDGIRASAGFYHSPVHPEYASRMNIPFRVCALPIGGSGSAPVPSPELETRFLLEAREHGLDQLQGHRSVGGIRASLYNAMPLQGVEALLGFMRDFHARHGAAR